MITKKSKNDLTNELKEQIEALRHSCTGYDKGHIWESKRISTTAYTLLHDGRGRSKSLLGILNIKNKMKFISSISEKAIKIEPIGWNSKRGLVYATSNYPKAYYSPKLEPNNEEYRWMQFHEWYKEVIFRGIDGSTVTRMNLIHHIRCQDGGAHVDTEISHEGYAYWKANGNPYLTYKIEENPPSAVIYGPTIELATGKAIIIPDETEKPLLYATQASMRQIGWELDRALREIGF